MYIYVTGVVRPGAATVFQDPQVGSQVDALLHEMESSVIEASHALYMFENPGPLDDQETGGELRQKIRKDVEDEFYKQFGNDFLTDQTGKYAIDFQRRCLERGIEQDTLPRSYLGRLKLMHAHTFVYALDTFQKVLEELFKFDETGALKRINEELNQSLPMLRSVRNSAHHVEDRLQRFASRSDKDKGRRFESTFHCVSTLINDCLTYSDGGPMQGIPIKVESIWAIEAALLAVYGVFQWTGWPRMLAR